MLIRTKHYQWIEIRFSAKLTSYTHRVIETGKSPRNTNQTAFHFTEDTSSQTHVSNCMLLSCTENA